MMMLKRNHTSYNLSTAVLSQMLRYLTHMNIDKERIFHSLGMNPDIMNYPDERISIDEYMAFEKESARISGDIYFGLHLGEFFEVGNWSILGYLMMNCRTLGEVIQKGIKYSRIISNLIQFKMQPGIRKIKKILFAQNYSALTLRHCYEKRQAFTIHVPPA